MGLSLPHLIILALVVLVLFGRGRVSEMMGDFGKGIKSFKEGMSEETNRPVTPPPTSVPPIQIQAPPAPASVHVPAGSEVPPATVGPVHGENAGTGRN